MTTQYRYKSLIDFVISHPLTVDDQLDDGFGAYFPVKGVEIEATILFADISEFTRRTQDLSPTETLIFANNFFSWITAEAVKDRPCIVDKYIGDEIMLIFSKEFGSDDPFVEALQCARWMSEHDALRFRPHIGIAQGLVTVGFVGTPIQYNCSVFGRTVALAQRCTAVKPEGLYYTSIVFPASLWGDRNFNDIFQPLKYSYPDGSEDVQSQTWELLKPRTVSMENIGEQQIREIVNSKFHKPMQSAESKAKYSLEFLKQVGSYRPRN